MSTCFWTTLVNATQVCRGEGPPDPPSGDWYVLVTGQNNNEAYVLTLNDDGVSEEPEAEFTLPGASSGVRTPYFSPSGDSLAVGNSAGSSASISGFSYGAKAPTGEITPPSGFFGSQGVATVRFSPGGGAVAAVSEGYNAPMLEAYRWEDATFGAKYSPPTIPPQSGVNTFRGGKSLAFSPNGDAIVVGVGVAPYIAAYPWSDSGGFGVKHANPSVALTSSRFALEFSVTGVALFTTGYDSSGISAFAFDPATGFGAKYSAPATLPSGNPVPYQKSLAVCPDNRAVALAHVGSPYVSVWRWHDVTGFGEKYANPSSLPANAKGVEFTPDGKFLIVTGVFVSSTSYTYVYKWDSEDGFGDLFVFERASISSAVLRPPVG